MFGIEARRERERIEREISEARHKQSDMATDIFQDYSRVFLSQAIIAETGLPNWLSNHKTAYDYVLNDPHLKSFNIIRGRYRGRFNRITTRPEKHILDEYYRFLVLFAACYKKPPIINQKYEDWEHTLEYESVVIWLYQMLVVRENIGSLLDILDSLSFTKNGRIENSTVITEDEWEYFENNLGKSESTLDMEDIFGDYYPTSQRKQYEYSRARKLYKLSNIGRNYLNIYKYVQYRKKILKENSEPVEFNYQTLRDYSFDENVFQIVEDVKQKNIKPPQVTTKPKFATVEKDDSPELSHKFWVFACIFLFFVLPVCLVTCPSDSKIAENGDRYNYDNDGDGRKEPVYVSGYYRKDGTYVQSHYRAR